MCWPKWNNGNVMGHNPKSKTEGNSKELNDILAEDWEELNDSLTEEKMFSSYNLLEKKRSVGVFFYKHPFSPGCEEPNSVSICIRKVGEWEIFLNEDGTWTLR